MEAMTENTTHIFERAGMGKAPFKVVAYKESKFQAIAGDPSCPILPGSTCDYCGQAIMHVYIVRSSDGVESNVGCDCVMKTKDRGIVKAVDAHVRKLNRQKSAARKAREAERVSEFFARVDTDAEFAAWLASQPHPKPSMADGGRTLADYVDYMRRRAGHSGRIRMVREVGKIADKG